MQNKLLLSLLMLGLLLSFGCLSFQQAMVQRATEFCFGSFNATCNQDACNFTCNNGRTILCQTSIPYSNNKIDCYGDGKF